MQMDGDESSNIEDRRGDGGGGGFGGGGFPIPMGGGGGGGGVFTGGLGMIGFILVALLFGADPGEILGGMTGGGAPTQTSAPQSSGPSSAASRPAQRPAADPEEQFVARVLKSTETVWTDIFRDMGKVYREPRLVLFRDSTRTECGVGQAAMGPFYCPADQRVYLDLGFFDELAAPFHAPGQFPQAYVIAHEIGHHVQNLLGISGKVKRDGNALSVRTELQADCFAGVWANRADRQRGGKMIDDRDIEQAMAAASAIGDDKLQRQTQGRIVPDSFTHGSSAQRTRWFRVGLDSGDPRKCDTFKAQQL